MLLTLDEHELTNDLMREARIRTWGGVLLGGNEALLVVRFMPESASPSEARTLLTTAKGICDAIGEVLPASVLAVHAVRLADEAQSAAVQQVWLPAASERRTSALLRIKGETLLRDKELRAVPHVDGRCLYLDLT